MKSLDKLLKEFESFSGKHIGLFDCMGTFEIQCVDETAPEGFGDETAYETILQMASDGSVLAKAMLAIDGLDVDSQAAEFLAGQYLAELQIGANEDAQ